MASQLFSGQHDWVQPYASNLAQPTELYRHPGSRDRHHNLYPSNHSLIDVVLVSTWCTLGHHQVDDSFGIWDCFEGNLSERFGAVVFLCEVIASLHSHYIGPHAVAVALCMPVALSGVGWKTH